MSSVGIQAGGEICESVEDVEGSWPRGSNEWTKTLCSRGTNKGPVAKTTVS